MAPSQKSFTNALRRLSQDDEVASIESGIQPSLDFANPIGLTRPASHQPREQLGKVATFISVHPLRTSSVRQIDRLLQQIVRDISSGSSSDVPDSDAKVLIVTPDNLESQTSTLPNIGGTGSTIASIAELVSHSTAKRLAELSPATVFESASGATISYHPLPAPLSLASLSLRQIVAFLASCRMYDWTFIFAGSWDSLALQPLIERSQQVFLIAEAGKAQYGEIQAIGRKLKGMNIDQQGLILLNADQPEGIHAAA